jgi:hypothetical protein
MTWLTWRQFRIQAITVYAGILVVAVVLAGVGRKLLDLSTADPDAALRDITDTQAVLYFVGTAAVALLPAIIGAFWGAPLITRELEAGTHRLVWNQSVTRTRWLAVKLLFIGATAMAAAALLSLVFTWWAAPIDRLAELVGDSGLPTPISPWLFDSRGIAPAGHAAFAFVLGVTVGVLIRRTVPAMAVTLAIFVAVQIAVPMWVRPHLIPPTDQMVAVELSSLVGPEAADAPGVPQGGADTDRGPRAVSAVPPGAWVHVDETLDPSGRAIEVVPTGVGGCAPSVKPDERMAMAQMTSCLTSLSDLGYRRHVVYHPPSAFWPLQWAETAMFLVMSVLLAGLCLRWTRHRLS